MKRWLAVASVAGALGCAVLPPAPQHWANEPEAEDRYESWRVQAQGFDTLEAYDLRHRNNRTQFAVARSWRGQQVHLLIYVTAPMASRGFAFVGRIDRDRVDGWTRIPRRDQVTRFSGATGTPGSGSPASMAAEIVVPELPGLLAHRRRPDSVWNGVDCLVIESRPLEAQRAYDRIVRWISHDRNVALRKLYYRRDRVVRSVRVEEVQEMSGRWAAVQWLIEDDETAALLRLENALPDAALPDRLFTKQTLEKERYPRF